MSRVQLLYTSRFGLVWLDSKRNDKNRTNKYQSIFRTRHGHWYYQVYPKTIAGMLNGKLPKSTRLPTTTERGSLFIKLLVRKGWGVKQPLFCGKNWTTYSAKGVRLEVSCHPW